MEIKILAITPVKTTSKGKQYTGIKYGDKENPQWVNVWGDHTGKQNKTMTISEPQLFGKSFWAKEEKPVQQPEVSQHWMMTQTSSDKLTKGGYKNWLEEMWELAMKLEPNAPDARAALVNTAMIAWSNNKIIDEFSAEEEEPPE